MDWQENFKHRIHRAWLGWLEAPDGAWDEYPDLDQYPSFYCYLKHHCGCGLEQEAELALLRKAITGHSPGTISPQAQAIAKAGGLVNSSYTAKQVVAWGRMACQEVFSMWGVDSQRVVYTLGIEPEVVYG